MQTNNVQIAWPVLDFFTFLLPWRISAEHPIQRNAKMWLHTQKDLNLLSGSLEQVWGSLIFNIIQITTTVSYYTELSFHFLDRNVTPTVY